MIILNNKSYNKNQQNTYRGREKKKLIYYIQTMNRLSCRICSVNMTFIKTTRSICL